MLLVTGLILALGTADASDNRPSEASLTPAQVAAAERAARMDTQGQGFLKRMQRTQTQRLMTQQSLTPMPQMSTGNPIMDRMQVGEIDPNPRTNGANP